MKAKLVILGYLLLGGCASLPGSISESVSGFDKATEITMEPAWVQNGMNADIKLGLYKTSRMGTEDVILTAIVYGAHNFTSKESLEFNVDGEKIKLESIDEITKIDLVTYENTAANWSSKRYEVKKDFINKLINGKEVWVKINLSQSYVEGKFSQDNPTAARPAFKKFYERICDSKH